MFAEEGHFTFHLCEVGLPRAGGDELAPGLGVVPAWVNSRACGAERWVRQGHLGVF